MADRLPPNAKRYSDERYAFDHLEDYHGIDPNLASARLHTIKKASGRRPDDNVIFDATGGVYDPVTFEWLGSLTEGGGKR